MKHLALFLALAALLLPALTSCHRDTRHSRTRGFGLVIYTTGEWADGFLAKVVPIFEQQHNCHVYVESDDNLGRLFKKLRSERHNPVADIVRGADNSGADVALRDSMFAAYKPAEYSAIDAALVFDRQWRISPVAWAWLSILYDSRNVTDPPQTFAQMTISNPMTPYIVENPDSTALGRAMLRWTGACIQKGGFETFWKSMRGNVLTVENDGEKAYHRFLSGEAALVPGLSTRPCYHLSEEFNDRYKAAIPLEGGYREVAGVGIVNHCRNLEMARKFVDFCVSIDGQELVPATQWMYPARGGIETPGCFADMPVAETDCSAPGRQAAVNQQLRALDDIWHKVME